MTIRIACVRALALAVAAAAAFAISGCVHVGPARDHPLAAGQRIAAAPMAPSDTIWQ